MSKKVCSICKEEKDIEFFYKRGVWKSDQKFRSNCKECTPWTSKLLSTISSRISHSRKKSDGTVNTKTLKELKKIQKGLCYWLKIPIDFSYKDVLRKPSLDRLDNSKGYTIDNIVLSTVFANTGRRDADSLIFKEFLDSYIINK